MRKVFGVLPLPMAIDCVLLIIRLVCGYTFIVAGWGKIQNPFGWMPADMGIPGIFLALAAVAEFVGGIALILGLLTRLAAFGIFCTMIVAVWFHAFVMGDPFINSTGGSSYQAAGLYLLLALLLLVSGPGRFSLDRFVFGIGNIQSGY